MLNRQLRENLYIVTIAYALGLLVNRSYNFIPDEHVPSYLLLGAGLFVLSSTFPPAEAKKESLEGFLGTKKPRQKREKKESWEGFLGTKKPPQKRL